MQQSDYMANKSIFSRIFSRRWEMAFLIFSGVVIVYTLRVNMSVAAPDMQDDLNWSDADKGLVLSSFYWGYAVGQIPASWAIQKYGAKWIFGLSVIIPSILTLFVPLACRTSLSAALFVRCLIGLIESASFPAVFHFYPLWIPLEEKTLMIPVIGSGMYMGEIIGFSLSGALVGSDITIGGYYYGGWQSVFYIFGLLGVLWFPLWALRAYESPDTHPYITKEEVAWIKKGKVYLHTTHQTEQTNTDKQSEQRNPIQPMISNYVSDISHSHVNTSSIENDSDAGFVDALLGTYDNVPTLHTTNEINFAQQDVHSHSHGHEKRMLSIVSEKDDTFSARIPYYHFFTHPVSLTLFFNSWTFGFIGFTLLSEMPSFFSDNLGFDIASAGWMCVFPYLALFISTLSFGAFFEYMQGEYGWTTDTVRQVSQYIAYGGSGIGLIICGFMDDGYTAYGFMIFTQFMMGAVQSGIYCSYSDVAPNFSSALNSVGNSIGAVAGIVGPLIVAVFTDSYEGVWGWRMFFFVTNIFVVLSLISWSIFQTSLPVPELNTPTPRHVYKSI